MINFKVFFCILLAFYTVNVSGKNLARPVNQTSSSGDNAGDTVNGSKFSLDDIDLNDWPGKLCARYCSIDEMPRICYFKFVLEHYHAMGPACGDCYKGVIDDCFLPECVSADGVERGVMSINRQIPGPSINVCKNDLIVVDVRNQMAGASASIHWHGLHQRKTPYMDGVPFITQCPITPSTTFRYAFEATQAGTQFYHSHSGHHKVNGHFGSLIIREPYEDDPNADEYFYDFEEHVILAADWMHVLAEELMPGLPSVGRIAPKNILINGRGQYVDAKANVSTQSPLEVYRVEAGFSYRFRFINSASHVCPLQLQIENHQLKVIAADSFPVKPELMNTLISAGGERYDFVLNADQPEGDYFVRIRAIGPCNGLNIEQFALLSYKAPYISNRELSRPSRKFPLFRQTFPAGTYLNHPNTTCGKSNSLCVSDLRQSDSSIDLNLLNNEPDRTIVLSFDNYRLNERKIFNTDRYDHFMTINRRVNLMGAINNISFAYPSFSLLTQPELIDDGNKLFCDEFNLPADCIDMAQCPCIHRIKVELNSSVELIIVDETAVVGPLNHPFHLHGYAFHVMEMGQHPLGIPMTRALAEDMLESRQFSILGRSILMPPLKDTISIPSRGFARIRFRADNPGFWFLHCHFDWHLAVGMALVIQTGEIGDMAVAPENFPKCSNFLPQI